MAVVLTMGKTSSQYYPPRAGRLRLFSGFARVRRHFWLDRFSLPSAATFGHLLLVLLVPGCGFYLRSSRIIGRILLCCSAALALLFFAFLGYPAANIAFGLLLSIHVTSVDHFIAPWCEDSSPLFRIVRPMLVLFLVGTCLYLPGLHFLDRHVLTPLNVRGHIVVMRHHLLSTTPKRGDYVAYTVPAFDGEGIVFRGGMNMDAILGCPGDRIEFGPKAFRVNGHPQLNRPYMPGDGIWIVPQDRWFVWPDLAVSYGHRGPGEITQMLMRIGIISREQLTGWQPFHYWFGREQVLP